MASSMKAAIHLGPDFLMNSETYKNTRFENIQQHHSKFNRSVRGPDPVSNHVQNKKISSPSWTRINIGQRSSDQMGEGKSLCLR